MKISRALHTLALLVSVVFVLAFTVGKAYISVPGVWDAEAHQIQQIRLDPLVSFEHYRVWWGPWFNLLGNLALFFPVGYLAYRRSVAATTCFCLLASLSVETAQYLLAAGYSDMDDLIFNTAGGFFGAYAARLHKSPTTVWMFIACAVVILVPYFALGVAPR
ncbi:VanZ family protein [Corynebacterium imitans]|uniref:VanZ family protein n=1 Tax=Corynebacterium imitans TaxID=156978 RepID=UPI00254DF05F|nr:VanZ family protein [Corynebacterium imitans]MDK8306735.1 VanZ family protein [Corynebacterium imitans]MDK8638148.1 VanZ family protein [Corynebacterium imitans]MDK8773210.1 VanZ family protein [Corynebacterium imitans]